MKSNCIIITMVLAILASMPMSAQEVMPSAVSAPDTTAVDSLKPTGRPGAQKWVGPKEEKIYFIAGFGVSADVVGFIMKAAGSTFSQMEIAGRLKVRAEAL